MLFDSSSSQRRSSSLLLVALFTIVLVLVSSSSSSSSSSFVSAQVPPAGKPYLDFTVRDLVLPFIYSINEQNYIYNRMYFNLSNGFLSFKSGLMRTSTVKMNFVTQAAPNLQFYFYLDTPDIDNVLAYDAMTELKTNIEGGLFLPTFTHVSSAVIENPVTSATVGIQSLYTVYRNEWSPLLKVFTSTTPLVGQTLLVDISMVIGSLSTDKATVEIPYPQKHGFFRINGGNTPTVSGMALQLNASSTEPLGRWSFDSSAFLNTISVLDYETFFITPPAASSRTYDGQLGNTFKIRANSFWRPQIDAVVTPIVTPSAGVTVTPVNVSITRRAEEYEFSVTAPPGSYTVTFDVPAMWIDENGVDRATDNRLFYPISTSTPITVLPTLDVTVSTIQPAFMPIAPDGAHGGAWSDTITVTLDNTPTSDLTIELDKTLNGDDVELIPSSFTWNVVSPNATTFQLRALTTGSKTIRFNLTGTSVGDYNAIADQTWVVNGPNPACSGEGTLSGCFGRNGCAWNQLTTTCSNTPLDFTISDIPLLYSGETSPVLNITLPTPVQDDLTLTFYADNRFTFVPGTIVLATGATNTTFQIVGVMDQFDPPQPVNQSFTIFLTGLDRNFYNQPVVIATVRPSVDCQIVAPELSIFPGVESNEFKIQCDQDPENDVAFVFAGATGVSIRTALPDPGGNTNAVFFYPGNTTMSFFLTGTQIVNFNLAFSIIGTNKDRYSAIPTVPLRVVNKGYILPPASFVLPQFETTATLHLDLSRIPILDATINVTIYDASTDAELLPLADGTMGVTIIGIAGSTKLTNTTTQFLCQADLAPRHEFTITGSRMGNYYMRFSIGDVGAFRYHDPTAADDVTFQIVSAHEGNAFKYFQTFDRYASDAKRACRLNHGYRSMLFNGQDEPVQNNRLCNSLNLAAQTSAYDCSQHTTRSRCRWALETNRQACAWVNSSVCHFVSSLQGNITQFSFGASYTSFLDIDGQVWTIGDPTSGQLGHVAGRGKIGMVELPETVDGIASGDHFTVAISRSGRLFSWGENFRGELGQNSIASYSLVYGEITLPRGENATCISVGSNHGGAATLSGKVFMWGSNQYGQLGSPESFRNFSRGPARVRSEFVGTDPFISVHCGARYTAIATRTSAYTFGTNTMGQLAREGYDEWRPDRMVFYNSSNPFNRAPTYNSFIRC